MNSMLLLTLAIVAELVATSSLKVSDGFSRLLPTTVTVIGYLTSFWLLSLTLRKMEVGVAYAIWSGAGTACMALIGYWIFDESMSVLKVASLILIVTGVIGLNLVDSAA